MKSLHKYIMESSEDGKNGHWEDFVDEDTGEIVSMWVNDPTPEELEKQEKEREENINSWYEKRKKEDELRKKLQLDKLDDDVWNYEQQLKDLNNEYRELRIDMEEELGYLYSQGDEAEAEKLAQKYGAKENKIAKQQESIRKKLSLARKRQDSASIKFWKEYDKIWN